MNPTMRPSPCRFGSHPHETLRALLLGLFALLMDGLLLGCASEPPRVRFESVPLAASLSEYRNAKEFERPFTTLDDFQKFDRMPLRLISRKRTGEGLTGAEMITIRLTDREENLTLKIKSFPLQLDGPNNSPRRELAAYAVQRFFLHPSDYVVPTSGVWCSPLDDPAQDNSPTRPVVLPGSRCALVGYALWLKNVTLPDVLYDTERFLNEPLYAYRLANFNLLTYLIRHHDQRRGNVLVSKNDADRRVFAIDNGISFDPFFFNWFYPPTFMWREILVPAVPKNAIDRLRKLRKQDLDVLQVIFQMEADAEGILRIEPPGPVIDKDDGVSVDGTLLQLGLTESEIEGLWERIEDLLESVDEGRLRTFETQKIDQIVGKDDPR